MALLILNDQISTGNAFHLFTKGCSNSAACTIQKAKLDKDVDFAYLYSNKFKQAGEITVNKTYTIGFTEKPLRTFIHHLRGHQVTKVIDTRLNNESQLAGYSKKEDLTYILELVGISYAHDLDLAPTKEMLDAIKKKQISWSEFEKTFIDVIAQRKIEEKLDVFWGGNETVCFLCSEHKPHQCHRRLIVEYLKEYKKDIDIHHLY